ncbi:glycerate kinase [Cellulosimicrobium sp. PMB13]|uniref:glycerate kinase n=1 Tax=Cellulosimicrobium sp. PMB13 TaxID=3120158 RepID=UPI003F4C55E1
MRVLVTGSTGPVVPDGAWPARAGDLAPASPDGAGGPVSARSTTPAPRDVARWWAETVSATGRPRGEVQVDHVGLASSGPAFLDAVALVAPELLAGVVPGPGGRDVPVAVRRDVRTGTVYADASQVPAVEDPATHDLTTGRRAPDGPSSSAAASSTPRASDALGHLVALCADAARTADGRPGRVVLATGGARSHDAGEGLLRALSGAPAARTGPGGPPGATGRAPSCSDGAPTAAAPTAERLRAARRALRDVRLVAAVATDAPLLGLHGASAALAARGVEDALAQDLERALGAVAHEVAAAVEALDRDGRGPLGRDLLATAGPRRLAGVPGSGSGGGAAFAVVALGGRLVPALREVADVVGLDERLAVADLVVVVVDELGAHEMGEGAVHVVAQRAARHAVPVVVVARSVVAGRREQAAAGLSGAYAWGQDAPQTLVERVARTWSRA